MFGDGMFGDGRIGDSFGDTLGEGIDGDGLLGDGDGILDEGGLGIGISFGRRGGAGGTLRCFSKDTHTSFREN